jgi:hypothetical protein
VARAVARAPIRAAQVAVTRVADNSALTT